MFVKDRDLLLLEPGLYRDLGWVGQRLVKGVGAIAGTTLTLSSHDVDFAQAGVDAGYVVTVGDAPYEVIARLTATTLTVSRLRAHETDPVLTPSPTSGKTLEVMTFRPQMAVVHAQVLRMIGIEPADPAGPDRPGESSITNPGALARVEALGALHLVYAAAAAPTEPGSSLWARADFYRRRFAEERRRAAARLDVDGDGVPDATRRLNVVQFVRE